VSRGRTLISTGAHCAVFRGSLICAVLHAWGALLKLARLRRERTAGRVVAPTGAPTRECV
jgi:hypothetical protein